MALVIIKVRDFKLAQNAIAAASVGKEQAAVL
jgi:hypothetical protein